MIYNMSRDLEARLQARKYPVHVTYGPERTVREGYAHAIVIERDRGASDAVGTARGSQNNPRKYATRTLAVRATIYAASSLLGAMIQDHERECEKLVDAFLVSLFEWQTSERAGPVSVQDARYLPAEERFGVETWPGVAYVIRFAVPRAVLALTYENEARPEAPAPDFAHGTLRVSIDGENFEEVP